MSYVVVLDANVLHRAALRDTLLRLAERDMFRVVWSTEILEETRRSLTGRGLPVDAVARLLTVLQTVFDDALEVEGHRYLSVVPDTVEENDRHVVATALAAKANVVVTSNLRHFPAGEPAQLDLAVQDPDEFLCHQFWLAPDLVVEVLREQVAALSHPPMTYEHFITHVLTRLAPTFASLVPAR